MRYVVFPDRLYLNEHWVNPRYDHVSLPELLESRRTLYRQMTGQKPQESDRTQIRMNKKTGKKYKVTIPGWAPIREGCGPILPDTHIKDFDKYIKYLEGLGVHVLSLHLHKDEGHIDPISQERVYNYHFHIIVDWTDQSTGKTIKLNQKEMRKMQTVLAEALCMERGIPKEITGAVHLSGPEYREYAAAEEYKRIRKMIDEERREELAQRERTAEARAEANRSMMKAKAVSARTKMHIVKAGVDVAIARFVSGLVDVGARILHVLGKGAVARAESERNEANRQLEIMKEQAMTDRKERVKAEDSCRQAESARIEAERTKDYAVAEAYNRGFRKAEDKCRAEFKEEVENLQSRIDEREKELRAIKTWNPIMDNLPNNLKIMKMAGMSQGDIRKVFTHGKVDNVAIHFEEDGDFYEAIATVELCMSTKSEMLVWFDEETLNKFKQKVVAACENHHVIGIHR